MTLDIMETQPMEVMPLNLLSSYGIVLLCLAREPHLRVRDVSALVGLTERAAQRVIGELVAHGYLDRRRRGRRNLYHVNPCAPFHPILPAASVGGLLESLGIGSSTAVVPLDEAV
jgi:hypothetical protein